MSSSRTSSTAGLSSSSLAVSRSSMSALLDPESGAAQGALCKDRQLNPYAKVFRRKRLSGSH